MIDHSKPYLTPNLLQKISCLVRKKDFISPHVEKRVKNKIIKKFSLKNIYFTESGTHAIYWIIKALKLEKNDEVIIPSYSCANILDALLCAGVTPVVCDVDNNWLVSRESAKSKVHQILKRL